MNIIYFYFNSYHESELPSTTDGLKTWLNDVWRQKEKRLDDFTVNSSFASYPKVLIDNNQSIDNALYLALMFWTIIQVVSNYNDTSS